MWSPVAASRVNSVSRNLGLFLLALLCLAPAKAHAAAAGTSYRASSIYADESPPLYGLRLDGFYDGNAAIEVTFAFDDVHFDQYNDGAALLRGEVSVAEVHIGGGPGTWDVGPGMHADEHYLLNVNFVQITDPAKIALIQNFRSDWTYYDIDPTGIELQRVGVPSDSTHLWIFSDNNKHPFAVGPGANNKNTFFGAGGKLTFKHYKSGKAVGSGPGTYIDASEFLMNLDPAGEPEDCDSTKVVDNYALEFLGVFYDFEAGTSRWEYELTWDGSPPGLSHMNVELCKDLTEENLVSAVPSNGHIGRDGSTGLYGIKWDPPPHMTPGVPVRISFTLNKLLDIDNVGFFPKASINFNYALICGPALDCSETGPPCEQNLPPVVIPPPVPDPIRCVSQDGKVCIPGWIVSDPEHGTLTYGTMGSGTFDPETGTFCKTVGAPGQYTMTLSVSDFCGATTTKTLTFEVGSNLPPSVVVNDDTVHICQPDTVCVPVTLNDEDPSNLNVTSNLGCLEDGHICFRVDTSGVYRLIVTVKDDCGLCDEDTAYIWVSVNEPPSVVLNCPGNSLATSEDPAALSLNRCEETVAVCEGDTLVCLNSRLFVTDPDLNDSVVVTLPPGVIWNPESGSLCVKNPVVGEFKFVFTATDTCGTRSADSLYLTVEVGQLPSIEFSSPDTTIYVCNPDTLLCFTVTGDKCKPGNIEEVLNPGTFDPETGEFCFNPAEICFNHYGRVDTTICVIFRATNGCGSVTDSLCITVISKPPPVVEMPSTQTFALCEPGEICAGPVTVYDSTGSPVTIVGVGAEYRDGYLCFTPSEPGNYYVGVLVTDTCGNEVRDSMRVEVKLNQPPSIVGPACDTASLCGASQVCVGPYSITDPDLDPLQISVSGGATLNDSGFLCFDAPGTGSYEFTITASDSCGSAHKRVLVNVVADQPPALHFSSSDTTLYLCDPDTLLCFSVTATGSNPINIEEVLNPGSYNPATGEFCFNPDSVCFGNGSVDTTICIVFRASNNCGTVQDSLCITIVPNQPPALHFSMSDTTVYVCDPDTFLCFTVTATDPDGEPVIIREILNPGTFNEATGEVCFNPDSVCFNQMQDMDTTICLVFGASDDCGNEQVDSLCIHVVSNGPPVVKAPEDQIRSICGPGQVCIPGFTISDPEGDELNITVSHGGSWQDGQICFQANEPGIYDIEVCATDDCGHTACDTVRVDVRINSAPVVVFGPDTTLSLCSPGPVCIDGPVITDADGDIPMLHIEGATQSIEGQLCFNATGAGTYSIVVRATDSCGASDADTIRVTVRLNGPPRVMIKSCGPMTLCNIDTTLCSYVKVTDMDGSPLASLTLIKTDTTLWSLDGHTLCLNAGLAMEGRTHGIFHAIVRATDICGANGCDTLTVELFTSQPPFVHLPADTLVNLCEPGEVCIGPVEYGDLDSSAVDVDVQGGTLVEDRLCVNFARDSVAVVVVTVTDSCGLSATDTVRIEGRINQAPTVQLPADTMVTCVVSQVCVGPVVISDPDISDSLAVVVSGGASLEGGQLCFTPTGDSIYTFVVRATDRCGASDADTIHVQVDRNHPPVLSFSSSDTTISLCHADTNLCFQVFASDPDGEVPEIEEILVPGFFDPATGMFCFNPDSVCFGGLQGDTTICVVFRATDQCGASVTDSLCIGVRVNLPPAIHFSSNDTTVYVCNPDTLLCFNISATDPEGDSVEIREILNPGEYYPELGQFCFNPTNVCYPNTPCAAGPTCVIFEAEDKCGNITRDTLCIEVFANVPPVVVTPEEDTVTAVQCLPGDTVCISPVFGMDYEDGQLPIVAEGATYDPVADALCFPADSAGLYKIVATTEDSCHQITTTEIWVSVVRNAPPVIAIDADDTTVTLCGPDTVCVPVVVTDPDGGWFVSHITGPAHFDTASSMLCVFVTTSDSVTVGIEISDSCGNTASDQIVITPTVNRPPVVQLPVDFQASLCLPGPYCFGPIVVGDPDSNLVMPPVVTGGTYDPATGQICIEGTTGAHMVIVTATDSCGLTDRDTVVVNLDVNRPPVTEFSSSDTSLFLCTADTVLCFNFSATDPDGGLVLLNEILNPGTFDPLTGDFCFNPSDICFGQPGNHKCAEKRYQYDTTICLIFSATDTCGAEVWDTLCVHVSANEPPVVVAPNDTTIAACGSTSFCLNPFQVSDPNGLDDSLIIISSGPTHTYDKATGVLCFTAGPGTYTFAVRATDRCGLSDIDSVKVTVVGNQPPVVTLPPDFTTSMCTHDTVCVQVSASDPDPGDVPVITPVLPFTQYHPATSSLCFVPDTAGVYRLIARATDRCGLTDLDTILVTVRLNRPPVWVSVPSIDTFFCSPPGSVCFNVSASDPEGQQLIYVKNSGPGSIDSLTGRICFTPASTGGLYTFIVLVRDLCGAQALDTATVNVHVNRPPVLAAMRDTLVNLCQPGPVCFPPVSATDPDNNSIIYTVLSGSGTLTGATYCFNADTSGLYAIRIKASDPCGLSDTVLFHASVRVNRPPTVTVPSPSTVNLCSSSQICVSGITASDVDGGTITLIKIAGPGTFNAALGQLCFTPAAPGTYDFDFKATDTCGSADTGRLTITVIFNRPPSLTVPEHVNACRDSQLCISLSATDPDVGTRLTITQVSGPQGTFSPNPLSGPAPLTGQWCMNAQTPGSYLAVFRVTDSCGATALDTTRIDVSDFCDSLCFAASIPAICPDAEHPDRWLFQGRSHEFPVLVTPSRPVAAFDFLIGYDASALSVQNVLRGDDISAWEFFTYRILNSETECGTGTCPSGLLRIVGIADINNGLPMSNPAQMQPSTTPREYARITFQVSNDRTLGGQFVAVNFWWNDCGDNTFSSPTGDLYVAGTINPDTCVGAGAKEDILACAAFEGGGGCIPTAADIDDRGDLNLNGLGYEISDAVLYSNYFIFGVRVFDPDPIRQASQVAASDVNADGSTLTVADLVFLIRIIVGLEDPIDPGTSPRLASEGSVSLGWSYQGQEAHLELEGSVATGALALEVRTEHPPLSVELSDEARDAGMELLWHSEGDRLKLLVYSMKAATLPPGAQTVLVVKDAGRIDGLVSQASSELGGSLSVSQRMTASLPEVFELEANVPNPFNPETEIRFTLNQPAEVTLSIFNVLGQEVARLADREMLPAGPYRYRWMANDTRGLQLSSGVYMYRLTAAGHSETRKMILLR